MHSAFADINFALTKAENMKVIITKYETLLWFILAVVFLFLSFYVGRANNTANNAYTPKASIKINKLNNVVKIPAAFNQRKS